MDEAWSWALVDGTVNRKARPLLSRSFVQEAWRTAHPPSDKQESLSYWE